MATNLNPCICSIFNGLADPVKQNFINLLKTLKTILQVAKANMELYNVNYADQAKLAGLKLESELFHKVSDPLVNSITALSGTLRPWSDCDPAQTIMTNLNKAKDKISEPTTKLDYEIALLEKAISEQSKQLDFLDNTIELIDNWEKSLGELCVN